MSINLHKAEKHILDRLIFSFYFIQLSFLLEIEMIWFHYSSIFYPC